MSLCCAFLYGSDIRQSCDCCGSQQSWCARHGLMRCLLPGSLVVELIVVFSTCIPAVCLENRSFDNVYLTVIKFELTCNLSRTANITVIKIGPKLAVAEVFY